MMSLISVALAATLNTSIDTSLLKSGDVIFQKSESRQSSAIHEATGSEWSHVGILFEERGKWVVAEANEPVKLTSLAKFVNRGRNGAYRIYRARDFKNDKLPALRAAVKAELGKHYDLYFEWSDTAIYCSELVYKAFAKAAGIELGKVQKFSDLKLDGPFVQMMIFYRLTMTGRKLNLDEKIVTPITQMLDSDLDLVVSNTDAQEDIKIVPITK